MTDQAIVIAKYPEAIAWERESPIPGQLFTIIPSLACQSTILGTGPTAAAAWHDAATNIKETL